MNVFTYTADNHLSTGQKGARPQKTSSSINAGAL